MDSTITWSSAYDIPSQRTGGLITLSMYKGKLYLIYRGYYSDQMWFTTSNDGINWDGGNQISKQSCCYAISSTVFNDLLYVTYRTAESRQILITSFNGISWTDARPIGDKQTRDSITLSTYENSLCLIHHDKDSLQLILTTSKDGETWTSKIMRDHFFKRALSSAVFNGRLYVLYRDVETNSSQIWITYYDYKIKKWNTRECLSDLKTGGPMTLTVFRDRLYLMYGSYGDSGIFVTSLLDGEKWSHAQPIEKQYNGGTFSSAFFNGQLYLIYNDTNGGRMWVTHSEVCSMFILDVWGEGRLDCHGTITGFHESCNLNKLTVPSNCNKNLIPNLIQVLDYENPHFPLIDSSVQNITLMGAPLTQGTVKEMCRVLDSKEGKVILYDPSPEVILNFEANKPANLKHEATFKLQPPFNQIKLLYADYFVYTFKT